VDENKIKTVVSYVSGTAGDFVVNCCNNTWLQRCKNNGSVQESASMKNQEQHIGDAQWLELINSSPYQYVGSHSIQRLLNLPVAPMWLIVPTQQLYSIWARRDCVTRSHNNLLSQSGDVFEKIRDMVLGNQPMSAAKIYLDWITQNNWILMKMRMVQSNNKIDVSQLLSPNGIDSVIDQIEHLKPVASQCRIYHRMWLSAQPDLSESATLTVLSNKLVDLLSTQNKIKKT
jgi:dynactin complex subunit